MASNWPTAKLGDVIDLFDSQRVPLNSRQRQERQGKFPYYGAQGIIDHIDGYIFDGRYILVAEDGENLNSKKLPFALFATGKFWVNNHAHILRGKPGIADDTFLLACLNYADIKPLVTGAAQPKLSQGNLRLIEIPLPRSPFSNASRASCRPTTNSSRTASGASRFSSRWPAPSTASGSST
jgi:type I restriction enzyme S subunit